ncbi:MAG: hypothetical protein ACFCUU_08350 [Cyclobacteriaceae bacterium]
MFFIILGFLTTGCQQDEVTSDGKVELYLLESYAKFDNSFQIDESTIKTKTAPLIDYADFISYDPKNYEFKISGNARKAIDNIELAVHGVAFAVMANDTLIYSGYFWPSYSSATCDWIVIDPILISDDNKIKVNLGYPGLFNGQIIPDNRNDSRIIQVFERDNKLVR